MGLFSSGSTKVKVVDPLAPQKTSAADWLQNLLNQPTPSIPTRQISGMTETEQQGQQILSGMASAGLPSIYTQGQDVLSKILAEPTDITALPEYKAIISSVGKETSEAVNQVLRRMQISGMETSSPQGKAVGKEISAGGERMLAELAPLAENERNRRLQALGLAGDYATTGQNLQTQILGAIQQYGALPRELDQAQKDAMLQQMMMKILFPYQYGGNIASSILGGSVDTAVQPGDPSIMTQIAPLLGQIGGSYMLGSMLG